MISKCENCGELFRCGATDATGCWCMELPAVSLSEKNGNCFCPNCLEMKVESKTKPEPLKENVDYYIENGRWVFTAVFHSKRGTCCGSSCRHCPYDHENVR